MQLPLQVTFHNLEHSDAIEEVRLRTEVLNEFCDHIMGGRVVVEVPHKHHRRGNQYLVRIDLTVPGEEIAVNCVQPEHAQSRNLDVALRDAFDTARRLLTKEDRIRPWTQRGKWRRRAAFVSPPVTAGSSTNHRTSNTMALTARVLITLALVIDRSGKPVAITSISASTSRSRARASPSPARLL